MPGNEPVNWVLSQPSGWRREWELRHGAKPRAMLRIPAFRAGAEAVTSEGRRFRIERLGRIRARYRVVDEETGAELARLEPDRLRRVLELEGLSGEWKRLGSGRGFGFVGPDGEPFVSARVRTGLIRSTGEVTTSAGLDDLQTILAALLACYLLIRRNEEAAVGAAASTAVVAS